MKPHIEVISEKLIMFIEVIVKMSPVGMNGAGRRIKDRSIEDRRYMGRNHVAT